MRFRSDLVVATTLAAGLLACGGDARPAPEAPGRMVTSDTSIESFDDLAFVGETSELVPASSRSLDAFASTMLGNPSIELVEVQAHVAPGTDAAAAQALADRRAQAVVDYVVSKQVAPARLRARGLIDAAPPARPRVEFLTVRRSSDR